MSGATSGAPVFLLYSRTAHRREGGIFAPLRLARGCVPCVALAP